MNRFLCLLALLMVGVVGLGFCLGWFVLTAESSGDRFNLILSVDKAKFQSDEHAGLDRVEAVGAAALKGQAAPAVGTPPASE